MTRPFRTASSSWRTAALAAVAAAPLAAFAHADGAVHAHAGGFLAGFAHPFTGADHLGAMVAVGLWSALVARRTGGAELLRAPLAFAAMLLAGALLGLRGVALPGVEPMIAASLLVLGLLVAVRLRLPGAVGAAVVGVFAVFHGIAHGAELAAAGGGAALVLAGMLAATVLLHGAGLALGLALRHRTVWLPRTAGVAVAGLGVALLTRLA